MKQFFKTYWNKQNLSPLVRDLTWTKLNIYLKPLDRDVKKPRENPSVGLILCTFKDNTVVEYALSRSLTTALISEYTLKLPNKKNCRENWSKCGI